jgi:membrane protease YdiL (CAAX protease family)
MAAALQLPLFYIGCWFAYHAGLFTRDLVSPVHIALGLAAGHLIFGLSLLITHRCLSSTWEYFIDLGALWNYVIENPLILGRFIIVGFCEEIIWRAAFQPMAVTLIAGWAAAAAGPQAAPWGVFAALMLVAVMFAVSHKHFFENSFIVSLEFLGFAVLLSVLYHLTGSLILVIVIHALRDIEITYLEYLVHLEETGDEEQAAREVEQSVMNYPRVESP